MQNPIIDKTYITAADVAQDIFSYGDIITKEWLMINFMLEEPHRGTKSDFQKFAFKYMECIEGFKERMLEEYNMYLISFRGEGYKIVMPSQQTGIALEKMRKTVRKEMRKAVNTMMYINEGLLTSDEIKQRDETLGKIGALRAFERKTLGH